MSKVSKTDVFKEAIGRYGRTSQVFMLIEEMAELQDAVCKYNRERVKKSAVIEEIADVRIMLDQLEIIIDAPKGKVNAVMSHKINRLKNRLKLEESK